MKRPINTKMKSYAKVNIFLKIVGKREDYHEIVSRFVLVDTLYDEVSIIPQNDKNEFNLIGNFSCNTEQNTIYKAFLELRKHCPKIDAFFRVYSVKVEKNIPEGSGLGGGSSNAATFLLLANELFDLHYTKDKLAKIGAKIGADVPFFIYEYSSANVSGIGEIVENFDEKPLKIDVITPKIECNTKIVFKEFREKFYKELSKEEISKFFNMKSFDILKYLDKNSANDLYESAISCYPKLKDFSESLDNSYYFSGSGSSFFKVGK